MSNPELASFTATRPALETWLNGADVDIFEPADQAALDAVLTEAAARGIRLLPIGGGTQIEPTLQRPDGDWALLSMNKLNSVVDVDTTSALVHVQAGATISSIQRSLLSRDLTLDHLGELPGDATVGGLLAAPYGWTMPFAFPQIQSACVGLTGVFGCGRTYHYIPAPRKASGPDLRFVFFGSRGQTGVITDAWLAATRRPEHRARVRVSGASPKAAVDLAWSLIHEEGLRPWQSSLRIAAGKTELSLDMAGPLRLVDSWVDHIERRAVAADQSFERMAVFENATGQGTTNLHWPTLRERAEAGDVLVRDLCQWGAMVVDDTPVQTDTLLTEMTAALDTDQLWFGSLGD